MRSRYIFPYLLLGVCGFALSCGQNGQQKGNDIPQSIGDAPAVRLNYTYEADVPPPVLEDERRSDAERNTSVQADFDNARPQELLDRTITSPDKKRVVAVYRNAADQPSDVRLDMYSSEGKLLQMLRAGRFQRPSSHTGQHYDEKMSQIFFEELDIPSPHYNLGISDLSHGAMTGRMLESIEAVIQHEMPDWVLVYGDTNSTLAGALAAVKLHVPVAHVEAGLRSFNMRMPEEINRIVADRVSTLLFCPTDAAVENLATEGMTVGVQNVGDVMYDAVLHYGAKAGLGSRAYRDLGLSKRGFVLATCHRQENTDDPRRMSGIIAALANIALESPVVFPVHPRTRKRLSEMGFDSSLKRLHIIEPISYIEMIALEKMGLSGLRVPVSPGVLAVWSRTVINNAG